MGLEVRPGSLFVTKNGAMVLACMQSKGGGRVVLCWLFRAGEKPMAKKYFRDGRCIEADSHDEWDVTRLATAEEWEEFATGEISSAYLA